MTCKDCIHYDVCMDYTSLKNSNFAQNFNESDIICDHFKDKSRIVELPCKVGDKVYYIHETYWDKDYKNQVINDNVRNRILKIVERQNHATNLALEVIHFDYCFIIDWIKGDIFLTKEEAERALKEREKV